jgi:Ca2+/H+ antiporter, TMEM165/GDT1 family
VDGDCLEANQVNPGIVAVCFGVVFIAELPDKTALASLVLGARYRPSYVFPGVAAAFAVHACLAVAAGSLLTLLPRQPREAIAGTVFLLGAAVVLRHGDTHTQDDAARTQPPPSPWRVNLASFAVIFVAEFGDITQIVTANLAVKYHEPVSVLAGSVLGLWAVAALAILGGQGLLKLVPLGFVTRLAAVVLAGLGIATLVSAFVT